MSRQEIKQLNAKLKSCMWSCCAKDPSALRDTETPILIQKRHPYTVAHKLDVHESSEIII